MKLPWEVAQLRERLRHVGYQTSYVEVDDLRIAGSTTLIILVFAVVLAAVLYARLMAFSYNSLAEVAARVDALKAVSVEAGVISAAGLMPANAKTDTQGAWDGIRGRLSGLWGNAQGWLGGPITAKEGVSLETPTDCSAPQGADASGCPRVSGDPIELTDKASVTRFNAWLAHVASGVTVEPVRVNQQLTTSDEAWLLWNVLESLGLVRGSTSAALPPDQSSAATVLKMAQTLGNCRCSCLRHPEELVDRQRLWLSAAIANLPNSTQGSAGNYLATALRPSAAAADCIASFRASPYSFLSWTFSQPERPSDRQLVNDLLFFYGVRDESGSWTSRIAVAGDDEMEVAQKQQQLVQAFMIGLLNNIRADPNYREKAYWVVFWRGWPQYLMLVVTIALIPALLLRWRRLARQGTRLQDLLNSFRGNTDTRAGGEQGGSAGLLTQRTDNLLATRVEAALQGFAQQSEPGSPRKDIPTYLAQSAQRYSKARIQSEGSVESETGAEDLKPQTGDSPMVQAVKLEALAKLLMSKVQQSTAAVASTIAPITEFRSLCAAQADALANTRWGLHLGIALLPILGFLGTVIGILDAMANIDAIVRADESVARVAAVSDIGERLGLAFATTALALVLGAFFKIWSDYLIARERYLVDGCEHVLAPIVDPALRGA